MPADTTCRVQPFDSREGGLFRISLTHDARSGAVATSAGGAGTTVTFGKLGTNERVVESPAVETTDPTLRGELTVTTTPTDAHDGTDVLIADEGNTRGASTADNETGTRMSLANGPASLERAQGRLAIFRCLSDLMKVGGATLLRR